MVMLPDDTFKDMKQQNYVLFLFKTYLTVDKEFLCNGLRQSDKYNGKLFTATFFLHLYLFCGCFQEFHE